MCCHCWGCETNLWSVNFLFNKRIRKKLSCSGFIMCSLFASYIFIWTNKRWRWWWWWWICVFVFLNRVMCGRTVMKHARRRKKSARLRWANTGDERVSDREGALAAAASVGWRARRLLLRKLLTWAPSSAAIFSASFWAGCSALVSVGMPVNSSWRLRVDGGEQELDSRRQTLVLYHTCPPSAISSRIPNIGYILFAVKVIHFLPRVSIAILSVCLWPFVRLSYSGIVS